MLTATHMTSRFGGELLHPGEAAYEEARRIWNGAIDRRPAVIARCRDAEDVMSALRFARECDLEVAVRGGGHGVAGHSVCDDGIVIDLSPMRGVHVDPLARIARVQAGALSGTSTRRRKPSGWRHLPGSSPTPAWRASRWAAESAG